jgi:hypothetical protein
MNPNLARQANVVSEVSFHGQTISFQFAHLAGIAGQYLNPAGGATSIAATAVENVDPRILDNEY